MRDNTYPVVAGTHQNKMLARPLCVCVFLVAACLLALPRGRFLQTGFKARVKNPSYFCHRLTSDQPVTKIILDFLFSWKQNAAADATQKANEKKSCLSRVVAQACVSHVPATVKRTPIRTIMYATRSFTS